jgi:putative membrane-bound dehydrogenase-like protein
LPEKLRLSYFGHTNEIPAMNRHVLFAVTLGLSLTGSMPAAQFKFPTQTFTVPDGFEVEQVAGPPVVLRPISGSFDEQGRLYVTDSSGSNDKVEKQVAEKPHRVLRLDPADPTGHFTKSSVFAEHFMFPEGCLWFDNSLYVSAPPSIWKLSDTNADGLADQRTEWHQGKTLTGCANDLHGPYLGLDGWIYWCKGAFAQQTYERTGRKPIVTRASHIFRAPPDHSDLEPVLTSGMDNPVGVVFSLDGERFMCGTFLMHPEAGKRDGVVHAVYGGLYGKPNDVLDGHAKTGDLMPIMTHLGAAAPCSVIRYESAALGSDYQDNLFVCCFNLHKVTRHVLVPDGATFKTSDTDFLVSDNPDFHPTDVIEDADGSLIVIDTGAWYKLCCPTSQLSKPDVLGAIYRIRRSGAPPLEDPRGLAIHWSEQDAASTARLLDDSRPAVRKRALLQLSKANKSAVPALVGCLKSFGSPRSRAAAVWALTRIEGREARAAVRAALADQSELVKHATVQSIALWRDREAEPALLAMFPEATPALQRAIAEALGRIGDQQAVPHLLQAARAPHDRTLDHSITYALIELDAPAETALGLKGADHHLQHTVLLALEQMDHGGLSVETITPLLNSPDRQLRETATWIAGRHADWAKELGKYFTDRLRSVDTATDDANELRTQLADFAGSEPIQEIIGTSLADKTTTAGVQDLLLKTIATTELKKPPGIWLEALESCLASDDARIVRSAVEAARTLNHTESSAHSLDAPLMKLAEDANRPKELRLEALGAVSANSLRIDVSLLTLLLENVDPSKPVGTRATAASVLTRARLSDDQLIALGTRMRTTGPLEITRLLEAFEQCTNLLVGEKLLDDLKGSKSRSSVRADTLQRVLGHYPQALQDDGRAFLESLQADLPKQRAHLEELTQSLGKGDVRRGQAVFNSQKAACSSCHAMGYLGGHVGPDLTSIGQIRTERDLLESIVYPSASFVRSFEPYIVRTKSDDEYNGVLRRDTPDEILLATGPTTEVRVARADIAEMRPGTVSVMPAGLDQQLSRQELADLVAFLKATKWGAK